MHKCFTRIIVVLFIALLCTTGSTGQIQYEIKKIAASRDFVAFKKYADDLYPGKNVFSYWKCFRGLTTEFKEGVFYFNSSKLGEAGDQYEARIITSSTKIIYCVIGKVNQNFDTFSIYKNKRGFAKLKSSFKDIFHCDINLNELFVTDFYYGFYCGFGEIPPGGKKILEFLECRDKPEILKWLQSTNTERQIYALYAFWILKRLKYSFTEDELKMINFVTNKDGTMITCNGDQRFIKDIRTVIKEFDFAPYVLY